MSIQVDILRAVPPAADVPADAVLAGWLKAALDGHCASAEVSLRIVGVEESRQLNREFRHKDCATNVLSFPVTGMGELLPRPLGDIVICAAIADREAAEQGKDRAAHWAHLCVHGALHLLGYDHETAAEAKIMESLEVEILARLGYQDPYRAEA